MRKAVKSLRFLFFLSFSAPLFFKYFIYLFVSLLPLFFFDNDNKMNGFKKGEE